MCGVAGVLSLRPDLPPPSRAACAAMVAALRHRGPDEAGLYRDPRAALGHARLSIVDLAGGSQPLSNEDGSLWISFNGEIFNHVELREELEPLGHAFRTRSDTEVIVHAWEAWGEAAFARFNGQFALALWDARRERLALARDPLGVRPLYTCVHGGRLWFASEVKALFAGDPSIPRRLDPAGLGETFTFWSVVPPQSVFAGIRELPPGHLLTVERGEVRERCFWRPRYPTSPAETFGGSVGEAAGRVQEALRRAVELRVVRSDVPVGSYLSGGLDSSLVAALGRRVAGERFRTFSVRFEDPEYDETPWQRAMARRLESDHGELLVRRADVAAALPEVVWHAERPILRTAPVPLFLLSRLVRETGVKVVLTGEGADETFAGYDLFREAKVRRFWGRRPGSALRPLLLRRLYPWLARSPVAQRAVAEEFFGAGRERWREPGFAHEPRWRSTAALWRLFAPDVREAIRRHDPVGRLLATLPPEHERWTLLAQDQYLEIRTLLSGYLLSSQGDRMLMAHSVEGRFPFLDPDVVALAASLPPSHKLRGLDEKHVLKRASDGLVPPEILRRTKQPYRAPDALAFAGRGAPEWVRELLGERAVREAGVFDPAQVARLARKLGESEGGQFSNADNMAVVGVLSTQLLHERLVRAAPAGAAPPPSFRVWVDRLEPDGRGSA
jgi:asparagine synthase (glutamine-hydrolysing)